MACNIHEVTTSCTSLSKILSLQIETTRSFCSIKKQKLIINKVEDQRIVLERIGKELNITKPTDWYNITAEQVKLRGGSSILYL
jgi:hypothetical protein